jgi:hypothetical protein
VTTGRGGATAKASPQPARPPLVEQPRLPVELPEPGSATAVAASVLVAVGSTVTVEGLAVVQQPAASDTIRYLKVTGRGADAKGSVAEKHLSFRLALGWVIPNVLGTRRDGPAHPQWTEWSGEFNQLDSKCELVRPGSWS